MFFLALVSVTPPVLAALIAAPQVRARSFDGSISQPLVCLLQMFKGFPQRV